MNNISTISEKIAALTAIAESLKADIAKAQECDSQLLDLFTVAREHVKDASNCLHDAERAIAYAKARAERLAAFSGDTQKTTGAKVFKAQVYFMPHSADLFNADKYFCKKMAREGAEFGIDFHSEDVILDVVVCNPGDMDHSWGNDGVPAELAAALGCKDEDRVVRFPAYIPVSLAKKIAKFDGVVIEPKPGVQIELEAMPEQGLHYNQMPSEVYDEVLNYTYRQACKWADASNHGKAPSADVLAEQEYRAGLFAAALGKETEAAQWFGKAADHGDMTAAHRIGRA